jgi:hypothetical protein
MSKRNTKQAMYQPSSPAKRGTTGARPQSKQARSSKGAAPIPTKLAKTPRVPVRASLLMVRITAIVIAVGAVIGGSAWAMSIQNSQGSYGTAQLAGLIALGFLAGLGIAVAMRTEEIAGRVGKMMRERR